MKHIVFTRIKNTVVKHIVLKETRSRQGIQIIFRFKPKQRVPRIMKIHKPKKSQRFMKIRKIRKNQLKKTREKII